MFLHKNIFTDNYAQVRNQQPKMAKNLPYLWCHSQKKQAQN